MNRVVKKKWIKKKEILIECYHCITSRMWVSSGWTKDNNNCYCLGMAQRVKRLPAMQETWVWSLSHEDPLEKEMATHSSTLAWKIPWTEKPGGLQSMDSQRVRHNWATSLHFFTFQRSDTKLGTLCVWTHCNLQPLCRWGVGSVILSQFDGEKSES